MSATFSRLSQLLSSPLTSNLKPTSQLNVLPQINTNTNQLSGQLSSTTETDNVNNDRAMTYLIPNNNPLTKSISIGERKTIGRRLAPILPKSVPTVQLISVSSEEQLKMTANLDINDIFDDLKSENDRLSNELKLSKDLIELLQKQFNYLRKCLDECLNCQKNIEINKKLCEFDKQIGNQIFNYFGLKNSCISTVEEVKEKEVKEKEVKEKEVKEKPVSDENVVYKTMKKRFECRKRVECLHCDYTSLRRDQLSKHMSKKHDFKCETCHLSFTDCQQLKSHRISQHSVEESNKQTIFYYNSYENSWKYVVKDSNEETNCKQQLRSKKTHKCPDCHYVCDRRRQLLSHISSKHSFKCRACKLTFDDLEEKKAHHMSVHSLVKKALLKCQTCDKYFDSNYKLKVHNRIHTGEKPFKCSKGCDLYFRNTERLKYHLSYVHKIGPTYACNWPGCDAVFRFKRTLLTKHEKKHTGESPHPCLWPGCERRFKSNAALNSHMISHTGEKNFACVWPQCGKTYARNSDLKRHILIHTNIRPLKCPIDGCDRTFIEYGNRTRHLKTHRNKL